MDRYRCRQTDSNIADTSSGTFANPTGSIALGWWGGGVRGVGIGGGKGGNGVASRCWGVGDETVKCE